jgi:glycosyltransferase involved in cell wall biosynthesis
MVTPFAPYRDGIATYAMQELRRLRNAEPTRPGSVVDVLSPKPSAARHHLRLGDPVGWGRLAAVAAQYDRTIIQFGPEMLFGRCRSSAERVGVWLALVALSRVTSLDLRIHEIEYGPLENNPAERWAARRALERADTVTVHTEAERSELARLIPIGHRVQIVEHGRDFTTVAHVSPQQARAELGLPDDRFLFLSIGFLQHHKGFDRAVAAIDALRMADVELHIVGSARVDAPDIVSYADDLARHCARVPGAHLHRRYVSDLEFDLWIAAADAVVVPYREIWSSGVVERARLLNTPMVAADLPQLRDQAPEGTVFFADDGDLPRALADVVMAGRGPAAALQPGAVDPDIDLSDGAGTGLVHAGSPPMPTSGAIGGARTVTRSTWEIDENGPDRDAVQAEVMARARRSELAATVVGSDHRPEAGASGGRALDPLLALGHLPRPQPTSARPGVAPVKRMVDRLISWRLDPVVERIEALQRATVEAMSVIDVDADERASADRAQIGQPGPTAPRHPGELTP